MSINLAAVRTGIKAALAAVDGLNIYDYEALNPELNAAVVRLPQDVDPKQVFGPTHWIYLIDVTVLVGFADPASADDALETLLDEAGTASTSVVVALRVDPTLGGACQVSTVMGMNTFGLLLDNSALGCNVTLEVRT